MYIVSGIGERHILSVFHEIINIILFYIDRCFNSLSCATRKIAISRDPPTFNSPKSEHARDPFQIACTCLSSLSALLYLILGITFIVEIVGCIHFCTS